MDSQKDMNRLQPYESLYLSALKFCFNKGQESKVQRSWSSSHAPIQMIPHLSFVIKTKF